MVEKIFSFDQITNFCSYFVIGVHIKVIQENVHYMTVDLVLVWRHLLFFVFKIRK